eukprot:13941973-Heterocapsa_arctica.AAC.1
MRFLGERFIAWLGAHCASWRMRDSSNEMRGRRVSQPEARHLPEKLNLRSSRGRPALVAASLALSRKTSSRAEETS